METATMGSQKMATGKAVSNLQRRARMPGIRHRCDLSMPILPRGGIIMATKNNLRSIRFSDEILEAIEAQVGRNFTEKFENMVTRCLWELPATEEKLKDLEARIQDKRQQLIQLEKKIQKLSYLSSRVEDLEKAINSTLQNWET